MQRLNAAPWLPSALLALSVFAHEATWAAAEAAYPQNQTGLQWVELPSNNCSANDGLNGEHYGPWLPTEFLPEDQDAGQQATPAGPITPAAESKTASTTPAAPSADQTIDPRIIEQAKSGDVVAQYKLGYAYYLGRGIAQDFTQAAIWWRKAAEQGFPQAQNNLGVLYNAGKGVPQSYSDAYFWQNLAAARANQPLQAQFAKNRDESAAKLSMWERVRVQKRASKWAAEHPVTPNPVVESAGNP